jgi:hypothetical protein
MKIRVILIAFLLISASCMSQNTDIPAKFFSATVGNLQINVPEGFEAIQNQQGFVHKGSASTLLITQMEKVPFTFAEDHFTKQNFEKEGARIVSTEKIKTTEGKDAILYTLNLNIATKDGSKTMEYERLILVTGDVNSTIFLVANYPVVVKKIIEAPIKTSLLSVKLKNKE